MTIIFLLLCIVAVYGASRFYRGNDSKLLPTSTPKGRQGRIVIGALLILLVLALIANVANEKISGATNLITSVEEVVAGIGVAVAFYIARTHKTPK